MNHLTKSRDNQVISGVCAGIAEYFNIDPTIVRLLWIFMSMAAGGG
ncbi:MAG: PspC domain-containing protein, partial [Erysipelotrichaceae bacterium]|nr:PspC domain-containing protein [Erysipelotrichaceae bacterium]